MSYKITSFRIPKAIELEYKVLLLKEGKSMQEDLESYIKKRVADAKIGGQNE